MNKSDKDDTKPQSNFFSFKASDFFHLSVKPQLADTDLLKVYQTTLEGYFTESKPISEASSQQKKYIICDEKAKDLLELTIGLDLQKSPCKFEDIYLLGSEFQTNALSGAYVFFVISKVESYEEVDKTIEKLTATSSENPHITVFRCFSGTEMWDLEIMFGFDNFTKRYKTERGENGEKIDVQEKYKVDYIERLPIVMPVIMDDLVSLQIDDAFARLYCYYDVGIVQLSAEGINNLQRIIGRFPRIRSVGEYSKRLGELIGQPLGDTPISKDFMECIIFDRTLDMLTPNVKSMAYMSLLDESENLNGDCSTITTESSIIGSATQVQALIEYAKNKSEMRYPLYCNDFKLICDLYIGSVQPEIDKVAQRIKADDLTAEQNKDETQRSLISYVRMPIRLQSYVFNDCHVEYVSKILSSLLCDMSDDMMKVKYYLKDCVDYSFGRFFGLKQNPFDSVEEMIYESPTLSTSKFPSFFGRETFPDNIARVLGRLSMLCGLYNGMESEDFDKYQKLLTDVYGIWVTSVLAKMEKVEFLFRKGTPNLRRKAFPEINSVMPSYSDGSDNPRSQVAGDFDPIEMNYMHYQPLFSQYLKDYLEFIQATQNEMTQRENNEEMEYTLQRKLEKRRERERKIRNGERVDDDEEDEETDEHGVPLIKHTNFVPVKSKVENEEYQKMKFEHKTQLDSLFTGCDEEYTKIVGESDINAPYIFVFVIGGITLGEISMLRLIAQRYGKKVIIGSTNILRKKTSIPHQIVNACYEEYTRINTTIN
ncbi:vacuolar protein sorting, putative [Entamoeba invadens IP1]|uniref:vacuolar protein sorting, putative n=1 Tax=Entamoeba invadens IP1 TaxID=370355 RepID=UPI0002C3EAFB|nr:vacuolar protein sorting, putative [Entamoeba invadens IP1]ELP85067.1 vacuolar protein sorting, putative [Entamoeba invadens IP1]|eukprot:XP_004184413.1 vacuolar protein sorting, putative [Entamoeba invadens IP1]